MAAVYENFGVRFLYPENWKLADEQATAWPRGVSVESPSGAFWSLQVYPPSTVLEQLLEAALATLREEYDSLDVQPAEERVEGQLLAGYDISFFYLDLVVQVRLRGCAVAGHNYVLLYQAEDAEFEQLEMVFRALTASLLRELAKP